MLCHGFHPWLACGFCIAVRLLPRRTGAGFGVSEGQCVAFALAASPESYGWIACVWLAACPRLQLYGFWREKARQSADGGSVRLAAKRYARLHLNAISGFLPERSSEKISSSFMRAAPWRVPGSNSLRYQDEDAQTWRAGAAPPAYRMPARTGISRGCRQV